VAVFPSDLFFFENDRYRSFITAAPCVFLSFPGPWKSPLFFSRTSLLPSPRFNRVLVFFFLSPTRPPKPTCLYGPSAFPSFSLFFSHFFGDFFSVARVLGPDFIFLVCSFGGIIALPAPSRFSLQDVLCFFFFPWWRFVSFPPRLKIDGLGHLFPFVAEFFSDLAPLVFDGSICRPSNLLLLSSVERTSPPFRSPRIFIFLSQEFPSPLPPNRPCEKFPFGRPPPLPPPFLGAGEPPRPENLFFPKTEFRAAHLFIPTFSV